MESHKQAGETENVFGVFAQDFERIELSIVCNGALVILFFVLYHYNHVSYTWFTIFRIVAFACSHPFCLQHSTPFPKFSQAQVFTNQPGQ